MLKKFQWLFYRIEATPTNKAYIKPTTKQNISIIATPKIEEYTLSRKSSLNVSKA